MAGETLLPCPCCAGDADVRMHDWRVQGSHMPLLRYAIDCPRGRGGCGLSSAWYETKAEAAAAWNRRASWNLRAAQQEPGDDARRLDWLEAASQNERARLSWGPAGKTIREALDAAMAATPETEESEHG